MQRRKTSGFTLVEVLTVVAVIALLAALILGLANVAHKKAARSRAEAEITQLEDFLTAYQTRNGQVPQTRDDFKAALEEAHHPLAALQDPWGMAYEYEASSRATFYLWSTAGSANRDSFIGNPK